MSALQVVGVHGDALATALNLQNMASQRQTLSHWHKPSLKDFSSAAAII